MSLREQLESSNPVRGSYGTPNPKRKMIEVTAYRELKARIHRALIERIDLQMMDTLPINLFQTELKRMVEDLLSKENVALNEIERKNLVRDIQFEMLGLGPLELLMADPSISDILVNTYRTVYVERFGKLEMTDICFNDDAHLMKIIDKIVSRIGRRVDESSPMVDARLPDGSRVNVIIPPLSIDGPVMSIRRFFRHSTGNEGFHRIQEPVSCNGGSAGGLGESQDQHGHFRRHWHRKNDPAEHPFGLYRP